MEREPITRRSFLKLIPGAIAGLVAGEALADPLQPPMSGKSPEHITLDDHEKRLKELAEQDKITFNALMGVAIVVDENDAIQQMEIERLNFLVPGIIRPDILQGDSIQSAKTVFDAKGGKIGT